MDYCSSCRRHLNGALVCPGCGAYAPDIAPTTEDGHTVPGPATVCTTAAWSPGSETWPGGGLHEDEDGGLHNTGTDETPYPEQSGGLAAVSPVAEGRAARRRQRARWKKNQRRAVVATAVALVGGGLTLGTMDRHSSNQAEAASAPDIAGPGEEDQSPQGTSLPTAAHPDAHRSSPTPPAPAVPRQRAAAPAGNTPSNVQPDSAEQPRSAAKPAPQPQTASRSVGGSTSSGSTSGGSTSSGSTSSGSASDDSGTASTPAPAPTGNANGGSDSGTSSSGSSTGTGTGTGTGTSSGTSQSGTSPSATSPSGEICVLVLCIG